MSISLENIIQLATHNEGVDVEFKETTGQLKRGMETLCGMINGIGGYVIFGVTNSGKLVGQDVSDKTTREIGEALAKFDLAHMMFLAGYIEHWGRGLSMMRKECERVGLPQPIITDNGFMVKVKFHRPLDGKRTPVEHQLNTSRTPVEHHQDTVASSIRNLIAAIGDEWKSSREIRDVMNFSSKSSFIKNYITPALELGYIQLENPQKPQSPNQRYGLTQKGKQVLEG